MFFTESLRKNFQFRYIYNHGKYISNKYLILVVIKRDLPINRLGICVSKKIGKSHVRNKIMRLIKENYRLHEKNFYNGFDMVFVAKRDIINCDFYRIWDAMSYLLKKHEILV